MAPVEAPVRARSPRLASASSTGSHMGRIDHRSVQRSLLCSFARRSPPSPPEYLRLKLQHRARGDLRLVGRLVPKYFGLRCHCSTRSSRGHHGLLKLPFDSSSSPAYEHGKVLPARRQETLTPVVLELASEPGAVEPNGPIFRRSQKILWGAMGWGGQWARRRVTLRS